MDRDLFVQNVMRYCKAKGVSPTVAGKESGAGATFLTGIKKQGVSPSIEKVEMLANYLGCTVNDLLGQTAADDPLHRWWDILSDEQKHAIFVLTNTKM